MSTKPAGHRTGSDPAEVAEMAGGLRTAVNRLAHVLRIPAAAQGLTPTRLTALATLELRGPMRPGDLASMMSITAASMSRLTEALEHGGWIAREPDTADRRACLLSVSDHGRATLEGLRREGATELAADIGALPASDRAALKAALPVLAGLADRHLGPAAGGGRRPRDRGDSAPAPGA